MDYRDYAKEFYDSTAWTQVQKWLHAKQELCLRVMRRCGHDMPPQGSTNT